MKSPFPLAVVLFAGVASGGPPAPADPAEHRRAQELVRHLGSPRYREREQAAVELVKMGRTARLALQEGRKHPDPEVHDRCDHLLPQALALDLAFRVNRFLKDPDGKLDHDLPLWKEFREKVGSDEASRKLYTEMVKANGAVLELATDEPKYLAARVQQRAADVQQDLNSDRAMIQKGFAENSGPFNVAEVCCLLFAAAQPGYKPDQPDWALATLFTQPAFGMRLRGGGPHRKVFLTYLDARLDDALVSHAIWPLCQYRVREGADVMARALRAGRLKGPQQRAAALCCIGTLGGREHIPLIAERLTDEAEVQAFAVRNVKGLIQGTVQVRDAALAMTIHLSGRNPKDYGFPVWAVYRDSLIPYQQLGFPSAAERAAAYRKWDEEARSEAPKK